MLVRQKLRLMQNILIAQNPVDLSQQAYLPPWR